MAIDSSPERVSVVIPTYNRGELVLQTVESVRAQTYENVEILVVDDGSSDNTAELLEAFSTEPNFKYIQLQHEGASAARNAGIRAASGEWVAFLDDDDLYDPEKLKVCLQSAEEDPKAVLVHTGWVQWDEEAQQRECVAVKLSGDGRDALLRFERISTSTIVARREALLAVGGFDENMWLVEDYDLWCRVATQGTIVCVDRPLTTVRIHRNNSEKNPETVKNNKLRVIEKYFGAYQTKDLRPQAAYIANAQYAIAGLYLERGDFRRAVAELGGALVLSWKDDPRRGAAMMKLIFVRSFFNLKRKVLRIFGLSSRKKS